MGLAYCEYCSRQGFSVVIAMMTPLSPIAGCSAGGSLLIPRCGHQMEIFPWGNLEGSAFGDYGPCRVRERVRAFGCLGTPSLVEGRPSPRGPSGSLA